MIIESRTKISIENDFKVEAGPGAGKTEFLINHIINVIQNSKRLTSSRKIACITYTNTGVETIVKRLDKNCVEKVEVSTIHSFLYKHIVKPYSAFLTEEYGVKSTLINGHDEFEVKHSIVNEWLKLEAFDKLQVPNNRKQFKIPKQYVSLSNWLLSMQCKLVDGTVTFECNNQKAEGIKKSNLKILSEQLINLKKYYWAQGKIDHNDVLYFSVILINTFPFILDVLRAKFPYIFLDEYQDTSPVQDYIIKKLKEKETKIGVIGDRAQSIFSFQGADISLFNHFKVDFDEEYSIIENHRSSGEIVDFLNSIRKDIEQVKCKPNSGNKVLIIVGDKMEAYKNAVNLCGTKNGSKLVSLSRDNISSNAMKSKFNIIHLDRNICLKYDETESNSIRKKYISIAMQAVELSQNGKYKEAIKRIEKLFVKEKEVKKKAVFFLINLLEKYNQYSDGTLMDFYNVVSSLHIVELSSFRNGKVKTFYEQTKYREMALTINIIDDTSNHITIHKAKGNQFENVMVIGTKKIKEVLLTPNLEEDEEHRVAYVAFSRAKNRLFIQFDELSIEEEKKIKKEINSIDVKRI